MTVYGIVAGGPKALLPCLTDQKVDCWIGCDRGCLYILEAGLTLYQAIGDFDSVSKEEHEFIEKEAKQMQVFSVDKDDSDLELAIKMLQNQPEDSLILYGITGGRLDHTLVNIALLKRLTKQGVNAKMMDCYHTIDIYLPGVHQLYLDPTRYISILPATDQVEGVTLAGFKYPLVEATLEEGSSLTLSNHLVSTTGSISFKAGILIVISADEPPAF
ncbi:thiamine pyrophosphokinase [Halolactibacillus halophilus]|uniref:Thiamine diphosphokinase n=1 Tax=Halolactibacillus halophilus TaxID=306540 RepID=A0A1I5LPE7_9BACI|nr:thiamine diphosphokinase [Halolactibacillus halophilus]GEM00729.1 thiamine pyrophosphokinase [Halolactibacillus halophilus]SFO99037.1 thiamine pyrophosphokinase [Halolactibacillus halophilus]